jgi:Domain of unknown function (DUF4258)
LNIRYHIDADTGQPHIYGHNVTEKEVEEILRRPIENRPGDRGSRVYLGKTGGGRWLRVIVSIDWDGQGVFVITAYDLRGKSLKALRRRMKKRGQS